MAYSVNLLLSPAAEAALADLQQRMKDAGVPGWTAQAGYRPHIELSLFVSIDTQAMRADLKRFSIQNSPVDLNFNRLELSGTEVILHPEANPQLMALQQAAHQMTRKYGKSPKPESTPGIWQPKLSLVVGVTPVNLDSIKPILGGISLPLPATGDSIGVFLVNNTRIAVQAEGRLGSGQLKDRTY